jgi:hypothetical protein
VKDSNLIPFQISTLKKFFREHFDPQKIDRTARISKLIQRSTSNINGLELLNTLLESALNPKIYPLEGIVDGMVKYNSDAYITKQGLSQRINTPECVHFFESIFKECLSFMIHKISPEITSMTDLKGVSLLNLFNQIIVVDSTEFPLHHSLQTSFKGSGGPQENVSAMKICAAFDLKANCLLNAKITDRTCPDQGLGKTILPYLKKNDLIMFDLGFFSIKFLEQIQSGGAYYCSRLHGSANVYENAFDVDALEVGKFIEKKLKKRSVFEKDVFLGADKFPVRMVAVKLDKKVADKRIKDYRKRCRKDKRKPSEENLERLKYGIYITNIPSKLVSALDILKLYKIRWQIELIFKNWKSQLNIDYLTGKNVFRIQTLILSRLISISIIWMLSGYVQMHLEMYYDEELSMHKSINWIKREQRFANLLMNNVEEVLSAFIIASKKWLCKENSPKKQTTRQQFNDIDQNDYEYVMDF